ncbi:MAG: bifunctional 23S rRNA (guanine(2069)-N(7))-methyltransferase RlmK/23S rRNA (guanine(2445)-N(2))-methyltransferase RlmL, partial [bacterium]
PMCGSGTLLIEGAMMAADIAPSLNRPRFGFQSALDFDEPLWRSVRDEAIERKQQGLDADMPEIRGYDKDTRAIEAAESNILAAGLGQWVRVSPRPIQSFKKPTHKPIESGLVISNPPYGERWGDVDRLRPVYQALGETVKRECPGWRLAVFTGNPDLAGELRLRPEKKYRLFNGTIASELLVYQLKTAEQQSLEPKERPLSEGALMVANRLKKNQAKLSSWVKKEQVSCYRLYDADIPEYAVAIDLYGEAIHVQEYAPPASVDEKLASRRMSDVRRALLAVFPNSGDKIRVKERRRQKGSEQYRKLNTDRRGASKLSGTFLVTERRARLEVNLSDYLDTGLFLDHRPVRQLLAEMAPDKRFLNLFCYTAAATVHAALGTDGEGARESTSVDMSNAYLDWARRNLEHNGLDSARHRLVRSDCLKWLDQADPSRPFDLIFLDPPTFSNSAKMEGVLDIQP